MNKVSIGKAARALIVFVLATALVSGCGDDSSGSSTPEAPAEVTTGSLSKASFIKQADAICQKETEAMQRELTTYLASRTKNKSVQSPLVEYADEVIEKIVGPAYDAQIEQIAALGAPEGDEAEVEAILTALGQTIERATDESAAFVQSGASFGEATKLAEAYGLEFCAGA
jgi:hypothetical protein